MSDLAQIIWGAIFGGMITGAISYVVTGKMFQEQRFDTAATKFEETIIDCFGDVSLSLSGDVFEFGEPVNYSKRIVNKAANKFVIHVEKKANFKRSIKSYNNFCESHKDIHVEFWQAISRKEFTFIIDDLLSFTTKKSFAVKAQEMLNRLPYVADKMRRCKF